MCQKPCFGHTYKLSAWNSHHKCDYWHCIISRDYIGLVMACYTHFERKRSINETKRAQEVFVKQSLVTLSPYRLRHFATFDGKTSYGEVITLQWRHNGHDSVSNHQPHDCLLSRLFRRRSKKTSKLRATGLCAGIHRGPVNSPHKWPVTRKLFPFDDVTM